MSLEAGSFWQELAEPERDTLRAVGQTLRVGAGQVVYHGGVLADRVTVLLSGYAMEYLTSVAGDETLIELLGPGRLEGELAAWGQRQRASLMTLTDTEMLRIPTRRFKELAGASEPIADALMRAISARQAYAGRWQAMGTGAARARLAFRLLELAERFGRPEPDGTVIPVPLTREKLAAWAGLSVPQLARERRRWKQQGVLSDGAEWAVRDLERLRDDAAPWAAQWETLGPRISDAAEVSGALAAGQSEAARPRRLPPDNTVFVGRSDALAELDRLLTEPGPATAVITGMGGSGKSVLAIRWAHLVADRFPDGVVFVKASEVTDALSQVLRAVLPDHEVPADQAELVALYRSRLASRRMLLIFDDAGDADQARPLLPGAPGCVALVTSREPLTSLPSRRIELAGLPPGEALDLFAEVLGEQDRRLADEPDAAAELARVCAHLPLALRLAAAKLAEHPDDTIAGTVQELTGQDRLSGFASHGETSGAVRSAFELSYTRLPVALREAVRHLGLMIGPDFTAESCAALLDVTVPVARERLRRLERVHMIAQDAAGRFRTHDLLKVFAHERALLEDTEGGQQAAQRRLLLYYRTEAEWRNEAWFESERRNLVAAVHQAAQLGLHRVAWQLADLLYAFLTRRDYGADNIEIHRAGLASARTAGDWTGVARCLHHLAVVSHELGDGVQAIAYDEEAEQVYSEMLADPIGAASCLDNLADVYAMLGRYPKAMEQSRQALAIYREKGEPAGEAEALDSLGQHAFQRGDTDDALGFVRHALEIRRHIGDRYGEAESLLNMARIHRRTGAFTAAAEHTLGALDLRQELADRHGEATAFAELAGIYGELGAREVAFRDVFQALRLYRAIGARQGESSALVTLGTLLRADARPAEALARFAEALAIQRDIGHRQGEATTVAEIGIVHWWLGRYLEAREHLHRALEIHREIGDRYGEARALEHLSRVMRRLGRIQESFVFGLEALDLWLETGARRGQASTLGGLARTYLRLGLYDEALRQVEAARRLRTEIDDDYGKGTGLDTKARVLRRMGRLTDSLACVEEALLVLRAAHDRYGEAAALNSKGVVLLDLGRLTDALHAAGQAQAAATELNHYQEQAFALHTIGLACQRQDRHAQAVGSLTEELRVLQEMNDHTGQIAALHALRRSHEILGDRREAVDCADRIRLIERWLGR